MCNQVIYIISLNNDCDCKHVYVKIGTSTLENINKRIKTHYSATPLKLNIEKVYCFEDTVNKRIKCVEQHLLVEGLYYFKGNRICDMEWYHLENKNQINQMILAVEYNFKRFKLNYSDYPIESPVFYESEQIKRMKRSMANNAINIYGGLKST